jgi:hypothetical protein
MAKGKILWWLSVYMAILAALAFHFRAFIQKMLDVGSGFTAQNVCSGVFVSGFSVDTLLKYEIAGLAAAIFSFNVNYQEKWVDVYIFKSLTSLVLPPLARSRYIDSSLGCRLERGLHHQSLPKPISRGEQLGHARAWLGSSSASTEDNGVPISVYPRLQAFLDAEVSKESFLQNQTRGVVVMHKGKIVGEAYQHMIGVTAMTPLLGWSMTKSAFGTVFAAAVQDGIVSLDELTTSDFSSPVVEHINKRRDVPAPKVTFRDLLTMADVIDFQESYDIEKTVPEMLYASGDCAGFALKRSDARDIHTPHYDRSNLTDHAWYYSSGVSNILSMELSRKFPSIQDYWSYPFSRVFDKIGASSFVLETDR